MEFYIINEMSMTKKFGKHLPFYILNHWTAVSTLLGLISRKCMLCTPPLELKPITTECRAETLPLNYLSTTFQHIYIYIYIYPKVLGLINKGNNFYAIFFCVKRREMMYFQHPLMCVYIYIYIYICMYPKTNAITAVHIKIHAYIHIHAYLHAHILREKGRRKKRVREERKEEKKENIIIVAFAFISYINFFVTLHISITLYKAW